MNTIGFPGGSEVPLNTHSQSDTQARTNMKPTHRNNHSSAHRPSMYLPVRCSLAAFSLSQPQLCFYYSLIFASSLCPSPAPSYLTFPCQMVVAGTSRPSGGGPVVEGERRGWLSMSVPDRSGPAFTLSKRAEPSLLISPRAAQSQGVGGLWKPLLSQ